MTFPDVSTMSRYVSPINPAVFPHLSVVLLGIGLFFTAWFFVYEVSPGPDLSSAIEKVQGMISDLRTAIFRK